MDSHSCTGVLSSSISGYNSLKVNLLFRENPSLMVSKRKAPLIEMEV